MCPLLSEILQIKKGGGCLFCRCCGGRKLSKSSTEMEKERKRERSSLSLLSHTNKEKNRSIILLLLEVPGYSTGRVGREKNGHYFRKREEGGKSPPPPPPPTHGVWGERGGEEIHHFSQWREEERGRVKKIVHLRRTGNWEGKKREKGRLQPFSAQ